MEQLPWEQKEQSLQVNTYVRDAEDTSDIKEQIQMDLDVKNSKSMKTSIIENAAHEKPANNENQKDDNSKPKAHKGIERKNGTNASDKKGIIELNNQNLNEASLSSKVSENDRDSSTFFDINSPDIIANDERLDTPKGTKNSSTTSNSAKIKRNSKNLGKSSLVANNIPNKKLKIFNTNEIKNNDKNLIDKEEGVCTINGNVKSSYSRSPSLFDDSLNLDTQMCDILEQNVMDIAHLTGLDSKAFASELDATNALQKESSSNTDNVQLCGENDMKSGISVVNLQSRNSVLSWGDDSWNNTEGLLKQIVQDQNIMQSKKEISNPKIKNIINTNISTTLKNTKSCTRNNKESVCKANIKKHIAAVKEKEPRKPKLPEIAKVNFPVANIIVFRKERKTSADSNKSDSDDFIVGSQHFESPFNSNKSRTRTTLEKIRKLRSQKLVENTITEINNHLNSPIREILNGMVEDKIKKEEWKVKPKLNEILAQNSLSANCNIDSVIYNSEDEAANNSTKSTFKTKQHETQSNNLDKNINFKIENILLDNKKDLLNETIDWNTLNIVKVANNRVTFNLFKREVLKKRNIALALHCETYVDNTNNIGSKICASNTEGKRKSRRSGNYAHGNKEIRGVAISWESNIAYYISFSNSQGNINVKIYPVMLFNCKLFFYHYFLNFNINIIIVAESKVSGKEQMALLKELFYDTTLYMKCFAIKDVYKLLYQCCGITPKCRFLDPVIAHWLHTNDCERNFNEMVRSWPYFIIQNSPRKINISNVNKMY